MAVTGTTLSDSFGELLRTERERLGLTLEQLSAATKVGRGHLEALEHGDYDALPHGIFQRGIVRAYLSSAGLQEDAWMPLFQASLARHRESTGNAEPLADAAWEQFADNVQRARPRKRESRRWRWLGVFTLFMLVAAGAFALWFYRIRALLHT